LFGRRHCERSEASSSVAAQPRSCAMTPAISPIPQCSAILPPSMRKMSQEVNRMVLPVGATPK